MLTMAVVGAMPTLFTAVAVVPIRAMGDITVMVSITAKESCLAHTGKQL